MNTVAVVLVAVAPIFPAWEQVTPQTMLKPVPEWEVTGSPGSVQRYEKTERLPDRCAVIESGKVVGYRLSCP